MEDILQVNYEGGRRFTSVFSDNALEVPSDQKPEAGGNGSAPEPFQLFLAALASCACVYIQGYCNRKGIDWSGIKLRLKGAWNSERRVYEKLCFVIDSEAELPSKDKALIETAIRNSAVYRQIIHQAEMGIEHAYNHATNGRTNDDTKTHS